MNELRTSQEGLDWSWPDICPKWSTVPCCKCSHSQTV